MGREKAALPAVGREGGLTDVAGTSAAAPAPVEPLLEQHAQTEQP